MRGSRSHRNARGVLCLLAGCAASTGAEAQILGRFSADAGLTEGFSSNPFLGNNGERQSVFAEISFSPRYLLLEPTASTSLFGYYRRAQYFSTDQSSQSYALGGSHTRQVDPLTSLTLGVDFNSVIAGERQPLFVSPLDPPEPTVPGGADPGTPPTGEAPTDPGGIPDVVTDPTLVGTGQRTSMLNVSGSLSTRLSGFDTLSASMNATRTFQGSGPAADYRTVSGSAAYSRTLSPRSSGGLQMSVSRTNYLGSDAQGVGGFDSAVIQPQLTFQTQLTPRINLSAALGAMFIKSSGGRSDSNSISGSFSACRNGQNDSMCISVSRDAVATGIGGVRKQFGASFSYSHRLGPYDTLGTTLSYSRYSSVDEIDPSGENLSTNVIWSTRLSERLSGGVSLSLRDQSNAVRSASADYNGQVYVSMRIGRLR